MSEGISAQTETLLKPAREGSFLFEISGKSLSVVEFTATEQISMPYHVELHLALKEEVGFDAVISKPAVLKIIGEDENEDRFFHGIINAFSQTGSKGPFYLYRATLVPQLWLLSLRQNCRIFQDLSVDNIIKTILEDAHIPGNSYKFSLQGSYDPRPYCVQYRETDLDFMSRLLEEEGIFYFFEHQSNNHTMVFGDGTVNYQPIPHDAESKAELKFRSLDLRTTKEEYVTKFSLSRKIRSGKATLKDYNFLQPNVKLMGEKNAKTFTDLEIYDYPGRFAEDSSGKKIAEVRCQEAVVFKDTGNGRSNVARVAPCFTFNLIEHENKTFNQEYLLVDILHTGEQPQVLEEEAHSEAGFNYSNKFLCIPSSAVFRPERKTPKSRVEGVQTAIVVGPAGEEIHTDKHGRVKVQFHWDRIGKNDDNSSCWIRVSQVWAGLGWGAMHIPRVKQEVIVDFEEGDPDKPIITGRVYHADNTPPHKLPDEKNISTLKSETTPGGKSSNELLMDDSSKKTKVVLSNAYGHKITEDEALQSITIETRDQNKIILDDKNKNISIATTNKHKLLFDDENKKIVLSSTDGHSVEIDDENKKITTKTTNGHIFVFDDDNKKIELTTTDAHGIVLSDDEKKVSIYTASGHHVTLDDDNNNVTIEDADGNIVKLDGGSTIEIESGGDINIKAPSGAINLEASEISLTSDGDIKVEAGGDLKMKGMNLEAKGDIEAKVEGGATFAAKGGAKATLEGGIVMIN